MMLSDVNKFVNDLEKAELEVSFPRLLTFIGYTD